MSLATQHLLYCDGDTDESAVAAPPASEPPVSTEEKP